MPRITVINHILPDVIHGGYEDAASIEVFIKGDPTVAHMVGYSGGMIPLDGPAPDGPDHLWERTGESGWIAQWSQAELEKLRRQIEDDLNQASGKSEAVQNTLLSIDVMQESYRDWTAANEPETHQDLYEHQSDE